MAIQFLVPGVEDRIAAEAMRVPGSESRSPLGSLMSAVRVAQEMDNAEIVAVEAEPQKDVVVLQIASGPELVLHPETARTLFEAQKGATRGRQAGVQARQVAAPVRLRWPDNAAGEHEQRAGEVLLAGFRVLRGDLADGGADADAIAKAVVRKFDMAAPEGLYPLSAGGLSRPTREVEAPALPGGGPTPILILVHGTFSTTEGSFGRLWSEHPSLVQTLFRRYDQKVYGFDHATLGKSPIENALDLVMHLPEGAVLHLLTHSRGGLVAEVLARACADPPGGLENLTNFHEQDIAALRDLHAQVRSRKVKVQRIVRVACPARGTLLASRRLDAYLSVLRWTLQLARIPIAKRLLELLGDVARTRLDADKVPGLAAQVPDSPLIQWLHDVREPISGDLRVIAGDVKGDSITSWLKVLISDSFFWTDNDLVVQTRSMYGGAPRMQEAAFVLDSDGPVSHFSYFGNEGTANAIVEALVNDSAGRFRPIGPLSHGGQSATGIRALQPATRGSQVQRPALFLLPGIVGSNLKFKARRVWLSWRLLNGFGQLQYVRAARDVEPDGVIGSTYDAVIRFFAGSHEVIPFDFDWRLPMQDEARRLSSMLMQAVRARVESQQPVRIVAHSMGGLLARAMQLECPGAWDEWMAHPGARLLMLGTPNEGSWAPMQVLTGDDSFGNTLAFFGAPFREHQARETMAGFPGLLQLQQGLLDPGLNLHSEEKWKEMSRTDRKASDRASAWHNDPLQMSLAIWGVPAQSVLDAAVNLRRRLDAQRDDVLPRYANRISMVLGTAPETPDGIELGDMGLVYRNLVGHGDGRVTDRAAMLPGVSAWRAGAAHGSLPNFEQAWPAYLELLEKGETTLLPPVPSISRSGPSAPREPGLHVRSRPSRLNHGSVLTVPDPLLAGDMGGERRQVDVLGITVRNSDLGFVNDPVIVGHYASLGLTGSEGALNRLLGGKLSRSLQAGDYPQAVGTVKVFHNYSPRPDNPLQLPRPKAVVVVGLGAEGNLQAEALERAVTTGFVSWALSMDDLADPPSELRLAATLIGSGGLNITPGLAAQVIARAVREANQRLRSLAANTSPGARRSPLISQVAFVELYLDRAGEAWRALKELQAANPGEYDLGDRIESAESGLERPSGPSYRGAEYDLIVAEWDGPESNGAIKYRVDTRRARSELQARSTQTTLLQHLLQSGKGPGYTRKLGRTLFQLLVPLELAPFMSNSGATQIELDGITAGIPWELLDTPREEESSGSPREPWAIRAKLLRKLRMTEFRTQPRDATRQAGALIIGEPRCPPGYARLPGARREAQAVLGMLQGAGLPGSVSSLIASEVAGSEGVDAASVIEMLLDQPWRVVHISGHGIAPAGEDPRGVVLSGGVHLGPREIESMRVVPELVFVNTCFSGALEGPAPGADDKRPLAYSRPQFAANVAVKLIDIGVKCVVATGWAVDDDAAKIFATTFYGALVRGARFIDAVAQARRTTYAAGGSTWGAYQCYGDPDWRLFLHAADSQRQSDMPTATASSVASIAGLLVALRTIATRATFVSDVSDAAAYTIRSLEERFADVWGTRGRVAEAFARAWEALGDTPSALRWYLKAAGARDGGASLRTTERVHSLRAKAAWETVRAQVRGVGRKADELKAARAEMTDARDELAKVNAGISLLERSHRLASIDKRLAMVNMALRDRKALEESIVSMRTEYEKAWEASPPLPNTDGLNSAMNVLAADVALRRDIDPELETRVQALIAAKNRQDPDFWTVACAIELDTWKALRYGKLGPHRISIESRLADLHGRVTNLPNWRSLHDHIGFVAQVFRVRSTLVRDAQGRRSPLAKEEKQAINDLLRTLAAYAYP